MKENENPRVLPVGKDPKSEEWKELIALLEPEERAELEAIAADLFETRTSIPGRYRLGEFVNRTERHGFPFVYKVATGLGFRTTGPVVEMARIVTKIPRRILPEIERIFGTRMELISWGHLGVLAAAPGLPDDEDSRVAFLVQRLERIASEQMSADVLRQIHSIERQRKATPLPQPPPPTEETAEPDPDGEPSPVAAFEALLMPVMEMVDAEAREASAWGMELQLAAAQVPRHDARKLLAHVRDLLRTYEAAMKLRKHALSGAIRILESRCPGR